MSANQSAKSDMPCRIWDVLLHPRRAARRISELEDHFVFLLDVIVKMHEQQHPEIHESAHGFPGPAPRHLHAVK